MLGKDIQGQKNRDFDIPMGITVTTSIAAQILGVSSSTFRRKASAWGLNTLWDKRGRRYSVLELMELKAGPLEPKSRDTITQLLPTVEKYQKQGFRFRVYGSGTNRGYLGFCACRDWQEVEQWLSRNLGSGTYSLKLLDEDNSMTGNNFIVAVDDPRDEKKQVELSMIKEKRQHIRSLNRQIRELERKKKLKDAKRGDK